jgi:7-keto-8-aminopelargonate synthetase-like enzyme
LYEECEQLFSSITGSESTVLVSSGFTAGRLAVDKWAGCITNLQPSHPAIRTGNPQRSTGVYAVDSVNVLTSSITNINSIAPADLNTLVIDDSHGIGITGKNGNGVSGYIDKRVGVEYVFTFSLSKALGIIAGAINCSKQLADEYRAMPAYTASTAPSPAMLYAFLKGQHIYEEQRAKLMDNIAYFSQLIHGLAGINNHPALPVFVLDGSIDEEVLLNKNIIISSFAYPDPNGKRIQRVVLNALHTRSDLEHLAELLLLGNK